MSSRFLSARVSSSVGLILTGGVLFTGCQGLDPMINATTVTPSSVALSSFGSDIQFTINTQVLYMESAVATVTASIASENLTYELEQTDNILNGEAWSVTTSMTLWEGFSEGTYYIDVTAVSIDGEAVTLTRAAQVTVTS